MKLPPGASREEIRVLVAKSNQVESQLLVGALRRHASFRVTACPAELSQCLAVLQSSPTDVVLIGDGGDGEKHFGLLRGLSTAYPQLGLIVMLDACDSEVVVKAFRSGARGLFCRASQSFKALCKCIYRVHKGQIWTNNEQLEYIIEFLKHAPAFRTMNTQSGVLLTRREKQVVTLVAEGLSNREIANEMKITENTVKKSILRIFDKLGVSSRVELVLCMLAVGNT